MDLTIDDFTKSLNPREETQTLNTTKANKVNNDCTIKPLDINSIKHPKTINSKKSKSKIKLLELEKRP